MAITEDILSFITSNNLPLKFWFDFTNTENIVFSSQSLIWKSNFPNKNITLSAPLEFSPIFSPQQGFLFSGNKYLKLSPRTILNNDSFTIVFITTSRRFNTIFDEAKNISNISLLKSSSSTLNISSVLSKESFNLTGGDYYIKSYNYPFGRLREFGSKQYSNQTLRLFSGFIKEFIVGNNTDFNDSLNTYISHILYFSPEIHNLNILLKLIDLLPFERLPDSGVTKITFILFYHTSSFNS
ncbi:MAG: hypothetical protein CV045_08415 [Cyanobacteria bacterium M5B4]|nr:MAG: hypothetical protein CV045_08415 [Cyanobacteria bacterium M5B4]